MGELASGRVGNWKSGVVGLYHHAEPQIFNKYVLRFISFNRYPENIEIHHLREFRQIKGLFNSVNANQSREIPGDRNYLQGELFQEIVRRFHCQEEYLGNDKPVNRATPLVAVALVTYNHVQFIEQCILSVINQKTNFPYEIVIGDDGSSDGTTDICRKYADLYPDKIRLFVRDRNVSIMKFQGEPKIINGHLTRLASRGKYVAIVEGDDFWQNPDKLQLQADFLEANEGFSACFTNAEIMEMVPGREKILHYLDGTSDANAFEPAGSVSEVVGTKELLLQNRILIMTWMMKSSVLLTDQEWFYEVPYGDRAMSVLMSENGFVGYIPEITATYRLHPGGIWTGDRDFAAKHEKSIAVFRRIHEYLNGKHDVLLRKKIAHVYLIICIHYSRNGNLELAKYYAAKAREVVPELTLMMKGILE